MQQLDVRLNAFEGPLDVLCHLIQKNKIDIHDIPIALLTDQYLEFIKDIQLDKMESMSSFIVMGASLLEIKSRSLLPGADDEGENPEDLKNALATRLIEYKMFKEIAEKMAEVKGYDDFMYFKAPDRDILDKIKTANRPTGSEYMESLDIKTLFNIYAELLKRKKNSINEAHLNFGSVAKELFTVNDKVNMLIDMLAGKKNISLKKIFGGSITKEEKIVTFLAVLELIKMKIVNIKQDSLFGDIELAEA